MVIELSQIWESWQIFLQSINIQEICMLILFIETFYVRQMLDDVVVSLD